MIMKRLLFVIGLMTVASFGVTARAASDTLRVQLGVYHCDNDSICEPAENAEFCPLDCVPPPATTTDDEPPPPQGTRVIDQIIDLFQTYIPFVGETDGGAPGTGDDAGYVCESGSCTTFTEDLTRSVIVSFEESFDEYRGGDVSIKPISGQEIAFEWEAGMTMRIMRSPEEFPVDPLSGELVYEGADGSFTSFMVGDADVLYYSLFPKYNDGSYGDPEFIIVKSQEVGDGKNATTTLFARIVNTFFVTILGFVGRFIFLLI